jgi:malic enzyme
MLCNIAGLNLAKKNKKNSFLGPSIFCGALVGASRKIRRELLFNMSKAWMTYLRPKSVVFNIVELW